MSPRPLKDMEEIMRLYREGLSLSEIGRSQEPPVSKQAIWNLLKRRGLVGNGKP